MKIACVGYIFGDDKITVSYDTVNKMFVVEEEYRDKDIGVKMGCNYSVKSKKEVRESLNRFNQQLKGKMYHGK